MTDSKGKSIIVRSNKQLVQPLTPEQKKHIFAIIERIEADPSCTLLKDQDEWLVQYDLGKGVICANVAVTEEFFDTLVGEGIGITPGQANAVCDEYFNIHVSEPRYEELCVPEEDDC